VLDQLRARDSGAGYLQPALAWLERWLAEQRGDTEEALRIHGDGEETASPQRSTVPAFLSLVAYACLPQLFPPIWLLPWTR
jgi:hypothetical protein